MGRIEQQGIAILGRTGDKFGTDIAASTGAVVNQDRLAQADGHAGNHRAGDAVHAGASRERHHHPDRTRRIGLRVQSRHCQCQHEGGEHSAVKGGG